MVGLYHVVSVDALVRLDFATGWENGDRNHGLRDEQMGSAPRIGIHKAAMQSSRSITSTSTVQHSRLSTSTMGVGSLSARTTKISEGERLTQRESKRPIEHFAAIFCYRFFRFG